MAIEIRHRPGRRALITAVARDQMQMQMASPLTKGDGIHTITATECLHKLGGPLNHPAPRGGLLLVEIQRSSQMSAGIQHTPPHQRGRTGVMTQQPAITAPDQVFRQTFFITMQRANGAQRLGVGVIHAD